MRTFILVCVVAIVVAIGMAFALGMITVATDHADGKYVITIAIDTTKMDHVTSGVAPDSHERINSGNEHARDLRGKVTAVDLAKNEFVVSDNLNNWTFQLARDGKVIVNDRESTLAELQVGDEATVTFDQQGLLMLASVVRSVRT